MRGTRTIDLHREVFVNHISVSRALALLVTSALVLVVTASLAFGAAVHAGIAPNFDQQIVLDAQHRFVLHNGPSSPCASIPNPPHHDCFWPGWDRREFSVNYFAPDGVQSLIWFRLPSR